MKKDLGSDEEKKMIHVCFPLHDKLGSYSKYEGAAICSILENTQENVSIHIIHDCTLSKENREKFSQLVSAYNQKLYFYEIKMGGEFVHLKSLKHLTVGTLFRLRMPEVLPKEVEKVIYLDADIIVQLDINELWKQKFDKSVLIARKDMVGKRNMCEQGVLEYDAYVNMGVMVLDLARIREQYDLYGDAVKFFEVHPDCDFVDQDALNYILKGKIRFLDEKYNTFTIQIRERTKNEESLIYHFAGDKPKDCGGFEGDYLFWNYLSKTPWGNIDFIFEHYNKRFEQMDVKILWLRKLMKKIAGKRKVFFGTKGKIQQVIMENFIIASQDYYVDNNSKIWDNHLDGMIIKKPEVLQQENKENTVVIVTTLKYEEVKNQLKSYGYIENENFFDGRMILTGAEGGYSEDRV